MSLKLNNQDNFKIKTVSIAILTRNRENDVLKAILSAKQQIVSSDLSLEIIVCDNASTDKSCEKIKKFHPDVKIIHTHKNLGCPGGRNILYANCEGEIIVNLDDDGELMEEAVKHIIDLFETDEKIGVVTFRMVQEFDGLLGSSACGPVEVSIFSGGLSAFKKEMLYKTGFYPDDFFLLYEEENLALRIIEAGYRIIYAPHVLMKHKINQQSSDISWDLLRYRNGLINIIEFYPKNIWLFYLTGRAVSFLKMSIRRSTFRQFLKALPPVLEAIMGRTRSRISKDAFIKYRSGLKYFRE